MKTKRLLCIFIAAAMTMSMASASFAADAPANEGQSSEGQAAPDGDGQGGDSAGGEQPGGGDSAGGEQGGGSSQGSDSSASDSDIVVLEPEELDELIIGAEGYEFTTDMNIGHLEIDPDAQITSTYPVIVFFEESDSVSNGEVIGNVQFVSDYDEVVAIVHTNDVHGHISVEPYVKGLKDELEASGDYSLVLVVSAGDIYGGGEAVAGSYNGEFIPAIMDDVYDVIVPGNNDFGSSGVAKQNLLLAALYDNSVTLCANMQTKDEGLALKDYADSYTSIIGDELLDELYDKVSLNDDGSLNLDALELENLDGGIYPYETTAEFTTDNGTVIGFYGLTTNGGAMDVDFDSLGSISSAQTSVDELKEDGATVIVGVGHTGWMGEGSTSGSSNDTNSWQLANTVTGQDVFIDGHTHSIINNGQGVLVGDESVLVNQAQCFGDCIGVVYLYIKDGQAIAKDGNVITDLSSITPDADVQAIVDLATERVKEDFGKPIAETEYFLNGERLSSGNEGGSVRGNETNLGDLMTDIIRAAASEEMGIDYEFAIYPGYWLRSSIEAGDITLESLQGVFANPTVIYYEECSAEDIVSAVSKGLGSVYPDAEDTTFNQYSGISVTYTRNGSSGTAKTIYVGDTLIYDADNGGIQVDDDWSALGLLTMTGGEIDNYTGDQANWICHDKSEVQTLVGNYFQNHTADDYTIYPNTIAPDDRIVEVED